MLPCPASHRNSSSYLFRTPKLSLPWLSDCISSSAHRSGALSCSPRRTDKHHVPTAPPHPKESRTTAAAAVAAAAAAVSHPIVAVGIWLAGQLPHCHALHHHRGSTFVSRAHVARGHVQSVQRRNDRHGRPEAAQAAGPPGPGIRKIGLVIQIHILPHRNAICGARLGPAGRQHVKNSVLAFP